MFLLRKPSRRPSPRPKPRPATLPKSCSARSSRRRRAWARRVRLPRWPRRIPQDRTAYALNQICGSGLRAIANAYTALKAGENAIYVAGGMESMSLSPHAIHLRNGVRMGNAEMIDIMIRDGLWDVFNNYHMGTTAENVAKQYGITREMQDEFALGSQQKAEAAIKAGKFKDEIVPITIKDKKGDKIVDQDEFPRFGATLEGLAKLKPAFSKDGTVTAGNASGINDGAAILIVMTAKEAAKRGVTPLARIASWATCGVDPSIMWHGPHSGKPQGARKSRMENRRPRPHRSERSLCGTSDCCEQGSRLGHIQS